MTINTIKQEPNMGNVAKFVNAQEEIIVKSGIPIPGARTKYPFGKMIVGDCFDIPNGTLTHVRNAAHAFGRANDMKFTVKKDGAVHRCWRIS